MTSRSARNSQPAIDRAWEIRASCAIGDHNTISRQTLRAVHALLMLAVNAARNRSVASPLSLPGADVILLVSNPVAHGAVLVESVKRAVTSMSLSTVGDSRLASTPLDAHFPSVSAASIAPLVTWSRLREAISLRRSLPARTALVGSSSRFYREYLFLAQAIRYRAIDAAVDGIAPETVLLADFDRSTFARPWIWAAKTRGLRTATLFHGSPNKTFYLPVLAGFALTWGSVQSAWLKQHAPDVTTFVIGRPDIDSVSRRRTSGPGRLVLCHSREDLSTAEALALVSMARQFSDRGLPTLMRLHPSSSLRNLSTEWRGVADVFDVVEPASGPLVPSLNSGDLVACVASSAAVDAIAVHLDAIVIADASRVLPSDLEALRLATPAIIHNLFALTSASAPEAIAKRIVAATGLQARINLDNALAQIRGMG